MLGKKSTLRQSKSRRFKHLILYCWQESICSWWMILFSDVASCNEDMSVSEWLSSKKPCAEYLKDEVMDMAIGNPVILSLLLPL